MSGFKSAKVKKLPTLACLGTITDVGPVKQSKPNAETGISYLYITVSIEGSGAAKDTKTNFFFRPEWLTVQFDPESLTQFEGGERMYDMYRRNIQGQGTVSALQGFCGSEERFNQLADMLLSLPALPNAAGVPCVNPDDVQQVLSAFLTGTRATLGYVLRQGQERTGEVDENGKAIWANTNFYNLSEFFYPTDETLARRRDYAEKQAAKAQAEGKEVMYKITWDEGTPF